jgi:peptidoglycan/LPS O-acetylase OafA/YrhL
MIIRHDVGIKGEPPFTAVSFHSSKNLHIQALRGLAALTVLIGHASSVDLPGGFGVDLFFCISGFIMMFVTHGNADGFAVKRIIRIVPLYWMATLAMYLGLTVATLKGWQYRGASVSIENLVKSFLFFPYSKDSLLPILATGWSLNFEVLFYLIFAVSCAVSQKWRGVIASAIIAAVPFIPGLSRVYSEVMYEFIYGILAYYVLWYVHDHVRLSRNTQIGLLFVSLSMLALLYAVEWLGLHVRFPHCLIEGVPALVLFLAYAMATAFTPPAAAVKLGDMSYSVYLVHYPVALASLQCFVLLGWAEKLHTGGVQWHHPIAALLPTLMTLAVTLAISTLSYQLIEVRLTKWLRKKVLKR